MIAKVQTKVAYNVYFKLDKPNSFNFGFQGVQHRSSILSTSVVCNEIIIVLNCSQSERQVVSKVKIRKTNSNKA